MDSAIKVPLSARINVRMIAFFGVLLVLIGYPVYIYLDSAVHGGINAGRHLTIQAGYMLADADVHRKDQARGFQPKFQGPIFGIQFR